MWRKDVLYEQIVNKSLKATVVGTKLQYPGDMTLKARVRFAHRLLWGSINV